LVKVEEKTLPITLGEYVIPHAYCWTYAGLKPRFEKVMFTHELGHVNLSGTAHLELLKLWSIVPPSFDKRTLDRKISQMKEELEWLSAIYMVLNSHTFSEEISLEEIEELLVGPVVYAFGGVLTRLSRGKLSERQVFFGLLPGLLTCCFTVFGPDGDVISPSRVLLKLLEKLRKRSPGSVNMVVLSRLLTEVYNENKWKFFDPGIVRTINALKWASGISVQQSNTTLSGIAVRNFFETAFLMPMNVWYAVDPYFFWPQRQRMIDMIGAFRPDAESKSSLGNLAFRMTRRIKSCATKVIGDPLGEERFVLRMLPEIGAMYVRALARDFMTDRPKLLSKQTWKTIGTLEGNLTHGTLGEFMEDHDETEFHQSLADMVTHALYDPEDCFRFVERRAQTNYEGMKDLQSYLFGNF
jgi:hypothetical protein